jgi:uncharacterized protein YacL
MNLSTPFKILFSILIVGTSLLLFESTSDSPFLLYRLVLGGGLGVLLCLLCFSAERLWSSLPPLPLRSVNELTLGIFCGLLFGYALLSFFDTVGAGAFSISPAARLLTYSLSCYLGGLLVIRSSQEFRLCIPFLQLDLVPSRRKEIILDPMALSDPRIVDLATSGLLDGQLVIPRCIVRELYTLAESGDEVQRSKARRHLDALKKLESIPHLALRSIEADSADMRDTWSTLICLAKTLNYRLLTADANRSQQSSAEGVQVINLQTLSHAMKPAMQSGESIQIKIQRYGKEPRQGVGYLEDGTMVVVNGGAEFIGETIKASVLSIKHTSSGRMIFCNTAEETSNGGISDDKFSSFSSSHPIESGIAAAGLLET